MYNPFDATDIFTHWPLVDVAVILESIIFKPIIQNSGLEPPGNNHMSTKVSHEITIKSLI